MCNITIETMKPVMDILSASLAPTIAICTGWFMWQQKEIQKKQHNTEIFKLRIEHMKFLFDAWGNFNTYISYIPNYKAQIIANNGNQEVIISTMRRVFADLFEHNVATPVLYNKNLQEKEEQFIKSLNAMIPSRGMDWTFYDILDEYETSKKLFNELYSDYQSLLYKKCRICD